jgi:hypothetical protein
VVIGCFFSFCLLDYRKDDIFTINRQKRLWGGKKISLLFDRFSKKGTLFCIDCRSSSVVERKPEELSVVGSIPISGTILLFFLPKTQIVLL